MRNLKAKFKFYTLVIPLLIFNQLFLNVFSRNYILAKTNQSEIQETDDEIIKTKSSERRTNK